MNPPYSFWADWLSKFHASSDLIKAFWIVAATVTALGVTALVLRGLRDILSLLPRRTQDGSRPIQAGRSLPAMDPLREGPGALPARIVHVAQGTAPAGALDFPSPASGSPGMTRV